MQKTSEKLEQHGYRVSGFVVRTQKKRKRVKGRARGFYEGKYVYLRVVEPGGKKRDIYLGTPGLARAPGRPKQGVDNQRSSGSGDGIASPAVPRRGGETGGRKSLRTQRDIPMRTVADVRRFAKLVSESEYDTRQHHPKQMKMPWEK